MRGQRYAKEHLERTRDVEFVRVSFDRSDMRGSATVRLVSTDPLPPQWRDEGNLIELLDGYRVIAVGRISAPRPERVG